MPQFNYQARRRSGELVKGTAQAGSREDVANQLRENGLYVVNIKSEEVEEEGGLFSSIDLNNIKIWDYGFKVSDLAQFSQQLSVLIAAGIPLVAALDIMIDQAEKQHVKEMLTEVLGSVEAGETLSMAFKQHPDYFPPLFVHLIKAGETGGVLDEVLEELVDYYKRRDEINKKVKAALYYPIVIVVVGFIAVLVLMGFVLPTILNLLTSFGGDMPLPTRIMVTVSNFINSFWWLILGAVIVFVLSLRAYVKTPKGKRWKDSFVLKVPVVGDLSKKIVISRFSSTLALLLRSGVNIINALPVLEDVVGNEIYSEIMQETRSKVREGVAISEPLKNSEAFPPMVIQMIKVGEESGNMEDMLRRIADYYDVEVENTIEGTISLIEPAMIVLLAFVVGGIVLSIILPLFEIYQSI